MYHNDTLILNKNCMVEPGSQVARQFKTRAEHSTSTDKPKVVASIMQEIGYEAYVEMNTENKEEIIAKNCVFYKLAMECDEVCFLDLSLISNLLDAEIEHSDCRVEGGKYCRFSTNQ